MISLAGDLPFDWTTARLDSLVRHRNEFGDQSLDLLGVSAKRGVVPRSADEGRTASDDLAAYRVVRSGDLVVNRLVARDGAFGVARNDGLVSPAYWVLTPGALVDIRFLDYALRSAPGLAEIRRLSKDMPPAQFDWPWPAAKKMRVPSPALAQQSAIADFLDRECARIDELREASLGLAAGMDAASRAVRNSELAGHVAEYGRVKLGWFVDVLPGYAFASSGFVEDAPEGTVRLLRGVNVAPGSVRWEDVVGWDADATEGLSKWSLRAGDLVLGMDRPWIGGGVRLALVEDADLPAYLLQRVARLRPHTDGLLVEYLCYWLEHDCFHGELSHSLTGVSVPHISGGQIESYRIAVPDVDIQMVCVTRHAALRKHTTEFRDECQQFAAHLSEYRDALVTEAVTGKLDVSKASEARMSDNLAAVREGADPEVLA